MILQSNSKIFTNTVFGVGTDDTAVNLINKEIETQQLYIGSSSFSNMKTGLPRVPSNQRVAKDN